MSAFSPFIAKLLKETKCITFSRNGKNIDNVYNKYHRFKQEKWPLGSERFGDGRFSGIQIIQIIQKL